MHTSHTLTSLAVPFAALTSLILLTGCPSSAEDEGSTVVDTLSDVVSDSDDQNSLREAIAVALERGEAVTFEDGLMGTISLDSAITIAGSITITGPGQDVISIDGKGANQIFVLDGPETTISGLTLTNASSSDAGGALLLNSGSLTLTDSTVSKNSAGRGAAIYMRQEGGALTISGSTFSENNASDLGGAIYLLAEGESALPVTITKSTFEQNTSAGNGGAINVGEANVTMTLTECEFTGNAVTGDTNSGGAIKSTSNLVITDSIFKQNTITGNETSGGAISHSGLSNENTLSITGSTFEENSSGGTGGALHTAFSKSVTLTGTTFSKNTSVGDGAGALLGAMDGITVTDSTFSDNSTPRWGGGAMVTTDATFTGTTIQNNSAALGGGLYTGAGITVTLGAGTAVSGNTATNDASVNPAGGGVCNSDSDIVLSGGMVMGNSPDDYCDATRAN